MTIDTYKFNVGNFQCTIFKDFLFPYQVENYFTEVNPTKLKKGLSAYSIEASHISSLYVSLLLEKENQKILIDSGIGFSNEPISFGDHDFFFKGKLHQLLSENNIISEDIRHYSK